MPDFLPLLRKINGKFSQTITTTEKANEETTITVNPIEIELKPNQEVHFKTIFSTREVKREYLLNFELDDSSTISYKVQDICGSIGVGNTYSKNVCYKENSNYLKNFISMSVRNQDIDQDNINLARGSIIWNDKENKAYINDFPVTEIQTQFKGETILDNIINL